jgi:threonine synthase
MRYLSTRGHAAPQAFCDILLGGLAPDGGLYLPEKLPADQPRRARRLAPAVLRRPGV